MSELEKLAAKRMRMLRLGASWSAEKLSQEYAKGGAGDLARTSIAKIEGGNRQIKAGELEGVARVFGLTSADLLGSDGPDVFLSYAEQDGSTGQEISDWLTEYGFRLLSADPAATDESGTGPGAERVISNAQAHVVLLTPNFLSSPRCREELDLAVKREQQLLSAGRPASFIYLLRVPGSPSLGDARLSAHALIELSLANARSREAALSKLGSSIISGVRAAVAQADPPARDQAGDEWLSRGEELERVRYALGNPKGTHFWLVVSPPGFGKSWFLGQIETIAAESASGGWIPSRVDLRTVDLGAAERAWPDLTAREHDAMMVVRRLFRLEQAPSSRPADDLLAAARKISRRSWLCLLDSAELLPAGTVAELRKYLGEIHRLIQEGGTADTRLALVVASRSDDGWGGLAPSPRLSVLPLPAFGPSAVLDAVEDLAGEMRVARSRAELRKDAARVQRVTEGMPDLVKLSLQWLKLQEWLAVERLDEQQFFDETIAPYVRDRLLAEDSILPREESQPETRVTPLALVNSLRSLVPYRLFTLAHVNYHFHKDCSSSDAPQEVPSSAEDLWRAIGGMALLRRPLVEPWQEIHPAIRRLLYRYFYRPGERAVAQARARDFTREWASGLTGKDQVIGIVEVIWHETARLRLTSTPELAAELPELARALSRDIHPSAYDEAELRDYAVQCLEADDELQHELASVDGLFGTLIRVIREPESPEDRK